MLRDMGAHDELSEAERRRAGQRRDARRRLHEEEARRLMCSSAGDELSRSIWRPLSLGAEAAMGLMETMEAVHTRRGPRYAEKMHRALKRACTASPLSYLNPDLHNLSEYALVMKSRETYESTCDLREESYRQYVVRLRPIELGAAEEVLHHLRQILHYATEDQVLGPSRRLRRLAIEGAGAPRTAAMSVIRSKLKEHRQAIVSAIEDLEPHLDEYRTAVHRIRTAQRLGALAMDEA